MHVAVDAGSGLVRDMKLTPANVQDISVAPQLLGQAAGTVYADRGYDSDKLRAELAQRELGDGLMRRKRGKALTEAQGNFATQSSLPTRGCSPIENSTTRSD